MPVDGTWATLLAGGAVAVASGLISSWYTSRREHESWLRDARRQAYGALLDARTRWQLRAMTIDVIDSDPLKMVRTELDEVNVV